jgi:hypothetical protein
MENVDLFDLLRAFVVQFSSFLAHMVVSASSAMQRNVWEIINMNAVKLWDLLNFFLLAKWLLDNALIFSVSTSISLGLGQQVHPIKDMAYNCNPLVFSYEITLSPRDSIINLLCLGSN